MNVEKIVGKVLDRGAEEAEVSVSKNRSRRILIENNRITYFEHRNSSRIRVMAIGDKKIGVAASSGLSTKIIDETISSAIRFMKSGERDPDFETLISPQSPAMVSEIFDKYIVEVGYDELLKEILSIIDLVKNSGGVIYQGEIDLGLREIFLANSEGVNYSYKKTYVWTSFTIYVSENNYSSEGFLHRASVFWKDLKLNDSLKKVLEITRNTLKPVKVEAGVTNILFGPDALFDLITPIFYAVNGDNVRKKRSKFTGKLGEKVASEKLTIIDDGTLSRGYRTAPYDGEGYTMMRKKVIDKGILVNYLLDNYTALKMDRESTGNAGSSRPFPSITPTNIIISPGTKSFEEIVSEIDKGIYVPRIPPAFINPTTGSFSVELRQAFNIRNGEIGNAVRWGMISGNIYDMIKNIYSIESDLTSINYMSLPSICFTNMRIEA